MELAEAQRLARRLMDAHGLTRWDLTFDRAKRRAGKTDFTARSISLSAPLVSMYDDDAVRDVVLHEIAHARVGYGHGHDATWKAEAQRIGATPRASITNGPRLPAPYIGTCPHGHRVERFRRPTKPVSCAKCSPTFRPEYMLTWNT